MLKTRGKRDLNLGSQPVIAKVSSTPGRDGAKSMLSSDVRTRGHMINLKKIMMPFLQDKMKNLVSMLIRDSVVLFYAGIDATNLHFSNKATHTGFIELGMTLRAWSSADQAGATQVPEATRIESGMKLALDFILKEFNEFMTLLAGDLSCTLSREILADCKADGEKDGRYFVTITPSGVTCDRQTLDLRLDGDFQPFLEIRYIPNADPLFEKYGVFYTPLKTIAADIKIGMAKYGTSDWAFRDITLQQAIERGGLTLTHWTTYSLLRECFPAITMRKMKVREAVLNMIEVNLLRAGLEMSSADIYKLKKELHSELDDYQNDARLDQVLNFKTLFKRSIMLGFLPPNAEFEEVLDNTYNAAILREIRVVMLPSK